MLDPKEERQYERLRKLAQELHIPMPEAFLTLEVFDKDGKLIQRHHQRSHSWTRNAYNKMFCQLAGKEADDAGLFEAGKLSAKDTAGTIVAGDKAMEWGDGVDEPNLKGYRALAANDDRGILVGSGTNAESFEDYALQTPIAEGTGAGQLNHVQSQPHSISYAALVLKNELVRYFNNNTVGETSVDVNEVALVGGMWSAPFSGNFLMSRDKLVSTVTVPSTGQLKVTYTIQLTFPS